MSNEMRVLERLAVKESGCEIIESEKCIFYKERNLKIKLLSADTQSHEGNYAAYLFFRMECDGLEEPIIEPSTALATSEEEALDRAADLFATVMYSFILPFQNMEMSEIENSIAGKTHKYKYASAIPVSCMGNVKERSRSPFDVVKGEIAKYLGTRKYNWVKLYVGRSKETLNCEARVNGLLIPELSDMLTQHAAEDENKDSILMEKQCILFIQEDETYVPLRKSPETIKEYALRAIPVITEIHDETSWKEGFEKIFDFTGDGWITVEIMNFIPEIVAQYRFSMIKHTSDITLRIGEEEFPMKKQQLTCWCACEEAVIQMLTKGKPNDEFLIKIMNHGSSYFNVMCQLASKFSNEELASGRFLFNTLICTLYPDHKEHIF